MAGAGGVIRQPNREGGRRYVSRNDFYQCVSAVLDYWDARGAALVKDILLAIGLLGLLTATAAAPASA